MHGVGARAAFAAASAATAASTRLCAGIVLLRSLLRSVLMAVLNKLLTVLLTVFEACPPTPPEATAALTPPPATEPPSATADASLPAVCERGVHQRGVHVHLCERGVHVSPTAAARPLLPAVWAGTAGTGGAEDGTAALEAGVCKRCAVWLRGIVDVDVSLEVRREETKAPCCRSCVFSFSSLLADCL